MDGTTPITPAVPQAGTNPRSSESATRAPAPAAGILTLGRPQSGQVLTFDTNDYSLIDFAQITNQWAALVQVGVTLRVVFSDGSIIELLHFFSGLDIVAPAAEGETTGAATESSDETRVRTAAGGKVLSSEEFSRAFWVTKTSGDVPAVSIVLPVSTVTTSIQTISFETIPIVLSRLPDLPALVLPDAPPNVPFVPAPLTPPQPATNQPPVITGADANGNMTEDDTPPSADGTIEFTDADIADAHAASVVPPPLVYIGAFAAMVTQAATGGVVGQVTWTYLADAADLQFLAEGQHLIQTYTVTIDDGRGGIATQVVTIDIEGINDPAIISGDTTGGVVEAGGVANSIPGTPVTTGDLDSTDVDNPDDTFTVVGAPTASANGYGTFTVTIVGIWSYTLDNTDAAVEALNVGDTLTDTFTVTTVDGTPQVVTITIDGANDDPVASPVTLASIQANSGPRTITAAELLAGVTDVDGPNLSITSLVIVSGLGALIDNPDDTWSFIPAANDSTSVTFDFTVTDSMAFASSTAFLDILPVNTLPPSLDLDGDNSGGGGSDWTTTFRMGGSPIPIVDVDVTITDTDSTTIASATFTLRGNGQVPPNDILKINGTLPAGITASAYNATTGVLTLTGVASLAAYQTALRQVVFSTTDAFYNADRIISVTVNDGVHDSNTATSFVHVTSAFRGTGLTLTDDPVPLYAFALDAGSPNSISFDLTNLISGAASLDHVLVFYSPSEADPWAWLDQSASPVLSASAAVITDANAGTYTALVFAGDDGVSAVSFTILGDAASEFDITVDAAGSGAGERDSGNRSIGDLIIVDDDIAGTVTAGGGDDVMWIRAGTGSHHLDGGDGDDALHGNAGNDTLDGGEGNNYLSGAGGIDVLTAGSGDDVLLGGADDDQLSSGDGDDVLIGGIGNDTLNAGAGHDGLLGGAGNDVLIGGGGVDQFVFAETGAANVDQITDYQVSDTINLSPLLDSTFTAIDDPLDFVRLVQTGSDVLVQVDVDGTAGGQTWQDVTVLSGYGTGGADPVNIFFAGTDTLLNA